MWTIFHTIKRSWTQYFVAQFSGLLILTLTYGALLFIALTLVNMTKVFNTWGKVNKVSVYLQSDLTAKKKQAIEAKISEHNLVLDKKYVSSQASANLFHQKFSKLSKQKLDPQKLSQFFPHYYEIKLNEKLAYQGESDRLESFAQDLSAMAGVKDVSYGKKWLTRYMGLLATLQSVGWFLIALFMLSAVVISASVIKTILFSRREEIEVLEFIGADEISIHLPQVFNVLLLSVFAFCIGIGFNFILFTQVKGSESELISPIVLDQLQFISVPLLFAIVGFCLLSVFCYSLVTIFNLMPGRKRAAIIKEAFR